MGQIEGSFGGLKFSIPDFFGKENLASIFLGGFRWYDEETFNF